MEVKLDDRVLGRGVGKSKKTAETQAARFALQQLQSSFTE
jgi:dsRNA-specific ribonuclease